MGLAGAQTLPEHLPGLQTFGGSCFQEDSDQHMLESLTCTPVPNRFSRAGLMGGYLRLFSQELKQITLGRRSLARENYTRIGSCISVPAQRQEWIRPPHPRLAGSLGFYLWNIFEWDLKAHPVLPPALPGAPPTIPSSSKPQDSAFKQGPGLIRKQEVVAV